MDTVDISTNVVVKIFVLVMKNVQNYRVTMEIPGQIRKPIHGQNLTAILIPRTIPTMVPKPKKQIAQKQNPNRVGTAIITCVVSAHVQRGIPAHGILGLHVQHVQIRAQNPMNVTVPIITNAM